MFKDPKTIAALLNVPYLTGLPLWNDLRSVLSYAKKTNQFHLVLEAILNPVHSPYRTLSYTYIEKHIDYFFEHPKITFELFKHIFENKDHVNLYEYPFYSKSFISKLTPLQRNQYQELILLHKPPMTDLEGLMNLHSLSPRLGLTMAAEVLKDQEQTKRVFRCASDFLEFNLTFPRLKGKALTAILNNGLFFKFFKQKPFAILRLLDTYPHRAKDIFLHLYEHSTMTAPWIESKYLELFKNYKSAIVQVSNEIYGRNNDNFVQTFPLLRLSEKAFDEAHVEVECFKQHQSLRDTWLNTNFVELLFSQMNRQDIEQLVAYLSKERAFKEHRHVLLTPFVIERAPRYHAQITQYLLTNNNLENQSLVALLKSLDRPNALHLVRYVERKGWAPFLEGAHDFQQLLAACPPEGLKALSNAILEKIKKNHKLLDSILFGCLYHVDNDATIKVFQEMLVSDPNSMLRVIPSIYIMGLNIIDHNLSRNVVYGTLFSNKAILKFYIKTNEQYKLFCEIFEGYHVEESIKALDDQDLNKICGFKQEVNRGATFTTMYDQMLDTFSHLSESKDKVSNSRKAFR